MNKEGIRLRGERVRDKLEKSGYLSIHASLV